MVTTSILISQAPSGLNFFIGGRQYDRIESSSGRSSRITYKLKRSWWTLKISYRCCKFAFNYSSKKLFNLPTFNVNINELRMPGIKKVLRNHIKNKNEASPSLSSQRVNCTMDNLPIVFPRCVQRFHPSSHHVKRNSFHMYLKINVEELSDYRY